MPTSARRRRSGRPAPRPARGHSRCRRTGTGIPAARRTADPPPGPARRAGSPARPGRPAPTPPGRPASWWPRPPTPAPGAARWRAPGPPRLRTAARAAPSAGGSRAGRRGSRSPRPLRRPGAGRPAGRPPERGYQRGAGRDPLPQRRDLAGTLPGPGHRLGRRQPGRPGGRAQAGRPRTPMASQGRPGHAANDASGDDRPLPLRPVPGSSAAIPKTYRWAGPPGATSSDGTARFQVCSSGISRAAGRSISSCPPRPFHEIHSGVVGP